MQIFREFFKTHSNQNIHQNAPNCDNDEPEIMVHDHNFFDTSFKQ